MFHITRRDPFRDMFFVSNPMNRMLDSIFDEFGDEQQWQVSLPLDVIESRDEYTIKATLPGIDPNDLEITYSGNLLTIKGEIKSDEETKEGRYHLRERRYGSFTRSITLPTTIHSDQIEASYESGVLKLRLPKSEEAKPKRIPVKSGISMIEGKATDITGKN